MDIAVKSRRFTGSEGVQEMSKDLGYTILLDIYAPLLTGKQRDTLDLYYNDDLSLGEIAENTGVTRQAVMNCIQSAEQRLDELERLMGIAAKNRRIEELLDEIDGMALTGENSPGIYGGGYMISGITQEIRDLL